MDEEKTTEQKSARLPDAELEVMLAVWRCDPPVTTARLARLIGPERNWKTPTLISFLERLKNRGFLSAEKSGREYVYTPLADRNEYVAELSRSFFERVHGGSVASLMEAVFSGREFGAREAEELLGWLETRARGGHGQSEIL